MMRLLVALLLVACGSPTEGPRLTLEHYAGPETPAQTGEVVATVNGAPIYAADVARQGAGRGVSAAQALDELIAAELLAQEAFRRGLVDDADVVERARKERVRVFMRKVFEPTFDGPEDMPQAEVDNALRHPQVKSRYDHPTYHTVAYTRADVKKKAPPEAAAAAEALAKAFAERARAVRPATQEAFWALAKEMKLNPSTRQVYTTSLLGPAERTFAAAAFTLTKPGDISEATRTPWGWDVLFLREVVPAVHLTRAEAEADFRTRFFEDARKDAFQRWLNALTARHKVTTRPELLDKVQVDSLVGL